MKELLYMAMKLGCKYQVRYPDYAKDAFTVPCLLTEPRMHLLLNDHSIEEIRIVIKP